MLEKLKGKKVEVGVAFIGGGTSLSGSTVLGGTRYYKGILVDYDDNFIYLDDKKLIGIKYIQVINTL